MKYSIDASSLLGAWRRSYPRQNFPQVWEKISELVSSKSLIATEEVLHELSKKDDDVYEWVQTQQGLFVPIDNAIQEEVKEILKAFPKLLDTRKNRSGADPFVIALAIVEHCAVVTDEQISGSDKRPKIPDVCKHFGIETFNVLEMIQKEGWIFT